MPESQKILFAVTPQVYGTYTAVNPNILTTHKSHHNLAIDFFSQSVFGKLLIRILKRNIVGFIIPLLLIVHVLKVSINAYYVMQLTVLVSLL